MRVHLRFALLLALAAPGAILVAPTPARAEAVLYRTADGQEGIVSDPAQVPPGATIVTERKRTVVRLPADDIERSILGAGRADDDAPRAAATPSPAAPARGTAALRDSGADLPDDGAWDNSLPPAPPSDQTPSTSRSLDDVSVSLDDASGDADVNPEPLDGADADDDLDLEDDLDPVAPPDAGRVARRDGARTPASDGSDALPLPSLSPEDRRAAELAHRERCEKLGLFGYSCTPEAMSEAERWAALARGAREKREISEARVAHLRERYKRCEGSRQSAICPKRELEAAERRLAEIERREEQIEERSCRAADCLPGWLRL